MNRRMMTLIASPLLMLLVLVMANQPALADDSEDLVRLKKEFKGHRAAGRLEQAETLAKKALALAERGTKKRPIITWLDNLGSIYNRQAHYREAEPLYKRSLELKETRYGPEHVLIAYTLLNLADVYSNQKKYVEAEPLLKRSLAIFEKSHGTEHLNVLPVQNPLRNHSLSCESRKSLR